VKSSHATHRDLAWALKQQAKRTGEQAPSVRGSDWWTATVATVGTDGTVTADGLKYRRMETYQAPTVGDIIAVTQSSNGNLLAWGRTSSGTDTAWVKPTLATGFTHDGNTNGDVMYRLAIIAGTRFLQWRGGLGITYASNSIQNSGDCLAAAIPAALRPPSTRSLTAACSAATSSTLSLKIDARPDGQLRVVGTTTSTSDAYATPIIRPPWVSLNGLQYTID
jgi:hypothetical protein